MPHEIAPPGIKWVEGDRRRTSGLSGYVSDCTCGRKGVRAKSPLESASDWLEHAVNVPHGPTYDFAAKLAQQAVDLFKRTRGVKR